MVSPAMDHTPTPLSRSPARTPLRHLADLLSTANAVCGIVSCGFAVVGRPDVSLVLLLVGAVCDGLDGAAARRFGGTRFGVLADDAADAISYAIAPAIAVAVTVSGDAGTIIGVAFGALTVLRLVFFTLKKGAADTDPAVFRGMPSTVGGVVVLSAAILWPQAPAAVAFVAGAAVVFMVSFDAPFAHLGRVLGGVARGDRQRLGTVTVGVAAVAVALGPVVLATVCLSCAAVYAAAPVVGHLRRAAAEWHQRTVGQNGM